MGPDPDNFQKKYENDILSNIKSRIIWTGWVDASLKWEAYKKADVYILSSHSENWGATVVESLMCGTPVLLSNKVNIWREVENCNAGLVDEDTIDGTKRLLLSWIKSDDKTKRKIAQNSRKCFEKNFDNIKAAKKLLDVVNKND